MLAVKGYFDGERVHLLEKAPQAKKYKVIVTFVEEVDDKEELFIKREYAHNESFSFWEDSSEDLYQDYLKKKKDK